MFLLLFLWCSLQLSPGKTYFQLKSPDIHLSGAFWQSGYTWRKLYKTLLMMNIKRLTKKKASYPALDVFTNMKTQDHQIKNPTEYAGLRILFGL